MREEYCDVVIVGAGPAGLAAASAAKAEGAEKVIVMPEAYSSSAYMPASALNISERSSQDRNMQKDLKPSLKNRMSS